MQTRNFLSRKIEIIPKNFQNYSPTKNHSNKKTLNKLKKRDETEQYRKVVSKEKYLSLTRRTHLYSYTKLSTKSRVVSFSSQRWNFVAKISNDSIRIARR